MSITVLIVEDERLIARHLRDTLERAKRTRPHAYLMKPINVADLFGALAVAAR